jgi:hypothetical protein
VRPQCIISDPIAGFEPRLAGPLGIGLDWTALGWAGLRCRRICLECRRATASPSKDKATCAAVNRGVLYSGDVQNWAALSPDLNHGDAVLVRLGLDGPCRARETKYSNNSGMASSRRFKGAQYPKLIQFKYQSFFTNRSLASVA